MDLLRRACRGQLGDHETDGGERRVRPIDRNQDAHGVRGWPGRVLAGTLAAGAWDRDTCDPFDEHSGPADAPASKERPARHRTSEAALPWLAARRAWALQDGAGADAVGGGRAGADPGAYEGPEGGR